MKTFEIPHRFRGVLGWKQQPSNALKALLGQTTELFAKAEGVSNRQKSRTQPQEDSLAVYDP
jgi:hypothetical protein